MKVYELDEGKNPVYIGEMKDILMSRPEINGDPNWPMEQLWDNTVEKVRISTIFAGISSGRETSPLLFETMIFCKDQDHPFNQYKCKYLTYREAYHGHQKALQAITSYFINGLLSGE